MTEPALEAEDEGRMHVHPSQVRPGSQLRFGSPHCSPSLTVPLPHRPHWTGLGVQEFWTVPSFQSQGPRALQSASEQKKPRKPQVEQAVQE